MNGRERGEKYFIAKVLWSMKYEERSMTAGVKCDSEKLYLWEGREILSRWSWTKIRTGQARKYIEINILLLMTIWNTLFLLKIMLMGNIQAASAWLTQRNIGTFCACYYAQSSITLGSDARDVCSGIVNWFPPYILTKTDAFGLAVPGTSLAEITHALSAQSRVLCKRCVYVSIWSLMYWAETCHSP